MRGFAAPPRGEVLQLESRLPRRDFCNFLTVLVPGYSRYSVERVKFTATCNLSLGETLALKILWLPCCGRLTAKNFAAA